MATKAHLEGNKRHQEKLDRMVFYVKKGEKEQIEAYAKEQGLSVNKFITGLIHERTGIAENTESSGEA